METIYNTKKGSDPITKFKSLVRLIGAQNEERRSSFFCTVCAQRIKVIDSILFLYMPKVITQKSAVVLLRLADYRRACRPLRMSLPVVWEEEGAL